MSWMRRLPAVHLPYGEMKLGGKLGVGGSGHVMQGTYKGMSIAIKKLNNKDANQNATRLTREVSTLAMFRHPNIISLQGFSINGPELYLVYEWMEGGSVADALRLHTSSSPLTFQHFLSIMLDTARAIDFMHSARVVHLDITPSNILLSFSPCVSVPRAKLADFGSAMVLPEWVEKHGSVQLRTSPDTLGYRDPELTRSRPVGTASDVYSLV